MLEAATAGLLSIVPVGKQIGWIAGVAVTMFLAGVGFTLRASQYADLPEDTRVLQETSQRHDRAITAIEARLNQQARELTRIRCLARLSATGEVVDPLAIDDRCP